MSDSDDTPLPAGWNRGYSNSQKRTYYFHAETKHTQWHFPTASEVADPSKAKKRSELNKAQEKRKSDGTSLGRIGDITTSLSQSTATAAAAASSSYSSTKRARNNESDSDLLALADSTSVAIIVPYRDIHVAQKRAAHLKAFLPHMHQFFAKLKAKKLISDYHVYIVEQSDDGRKFNRGKLLNIGFDYARKNHITTGNSSKHKTEQTTTRRTTPLKHDVFIFHDVDLLPDDNLGSWYAEFPKVPIHIARVWDRYSNNPKYFGGVVSFSESDYKRINGYPNTFWYVRFTEMLYSLRSLLSS
jgi:hypothetical protein